MILFKTLENPYIKECPFYDDFERIIAKCRNLTDNLLKTKLEDQHSLYNDEESDGLTMYESEELALAIRIVQFERNPDAFKKENTENITVLDLTADIPDTNTHPENSPMHSLFEKEVHSLIKECSKKELIDDLNREINIYNSKQNRSLESEAALYNSIHSLKTAIKKHK